MRLDINEMLKLLKSDDPFAMCPIANPKIPKGACSITKELFHCPVDLKKIYCCKDCSKSETCPRRCSVLEEVRRLADAFGYI